MKKTKPLVSLLHCAAIAGFTFVSSQTQAATILHHWSFDGDLTDSVGTADGAKEGGGTASYSTGQHGQALSFDGVDDYISTSLGTIVPSTDYTLMAWVSWNGSATRSYIAGGQSGGALGEVFTLGRTDGDTTLFLNLLANGGQGDSIAESVDTLATDGTWMHVAYTLSSTGGTTLYLNGTSVDTNPTRTTHDPDDTFNIGGTNPSGTAPTNFMDGLIDDVAIFDGVLTSSEINSFAANGIPEPSSFALIAGFLGLTSVMLRRRHG